MIGQVGGLVKGRYHDNLETIQWMKRYIELHGGPQAQYDPVARRGRITVELPAGKLKGRQGNKQNAKCIEGLKGAAKPDILTAAHSFDLLPNYRPKMLENSGLQTRKLSNVRSVDLMPKMNRKVSCHVKKGHIRMTSDVALQLEAPRATMNYLTTEADEDPRIIRIFQILSEGVEEKVQIGKIRQLLGWKPPLFQGDDI